MTPRLNVHSASILRDAKCDTPSSDIEGPWPMLCPEENEPLPGSTSLFKLLELLGNSGTPQHMICTNLCSCTNLGHDLLVCNSLHGCAVINHLCHCWLQKHNMIYDCTSVVIALHDPAWVAQGDRMKALHHQEHPHQEQKYCHCSFHRTWYNGCCATCHTQMQTQNVILLWQWSDSQASAEEFCVKSQICEMASLACDLHKFVILHILWFSRGSD